MKSIARQTGGQIDTISTLGNGSRVALIEVKEGSELDTAATLEREDKVLFVQPNYIYTPEEAATGDTDSDPVALRNDPGFPDDPLYGEDQAYLSVDPTVEGEPKKGSMNAKGAWDKLAELDELGELDGREKPIVAVLDSGVRLDH